MLGIGVKRKLDEDDDVLEEERRPAAPGAMSHASFTLQRQTVLNVSLVKLYGPRTGGGLGLRRRVLINNVVRRIHDDFRQEGGVGALFFSAAPPAGGSVAAVCEDEGYRQAPPPPASFSILSSPLTGLAALDSCLTPASLLEEDLPMFFTLPPPPSPSSTQHHPNHSQRPSPSPKDSFSSALEEIEELCPPSSSSSSSSSGPPVSTSWPMAPAVMADDLVRSMSGYGAAGGGAQNPPFKMDLAELDHIMEVLVGS
uniref:SERTA domain containing 2 n=1 Tax=Gasterosteus aculeatus aculeatus TaxID=481459 RepID=G3Q7U5_GASAC